MIELSLLNAEVGHKVWRGKVGGWRRLDGEDRDGDEPRRGGRDGGGERKQEVGYLRCERDFVSYFWGENT